MKTRAMAAGALLWAAGCMPWPRPDPFPELVRLLHSAGTEDHEKAFQVLLHAGSQALPLLKAALPLGAARGFPLVAVLYALGEGDAVPLEFRIRHAALFDWPRPYAVENAVVEPYVWDELERDIVRTGRPALRPLAEALAREASTEARALRLARLMIWIGGYGAAEAFARLLDTRRDLGGPRVCDVAAAAMLYLGEQEPALREVRAEARLEAARAWWTQAREEPEEEWSRRAALALAERAAGGDEAARAVLELVAGGPVEDPALWRPGPPRDAELPPERHLPALSAGRAPAWAAERRLERLTGLRLAPPRWRRLGELTSAIRLWRPAPDLERAWKRLLEGRSLRLSVTAVGLHPKRETAGVLGVEETYFHASEDGSVELALEVEEGTYVLYARARRAGTRLVAAEYLSAEGGQRGRVEEHAADRPAVLFSAPLRAALLVEVAEVPGRLPPRPPEALLADIRARLRAAAAEAPGSPSARRALRALGYCQNDQDAEFLRERGAYEALLLLGHPAALEGAPRLEPYEIEMALRKARDPAVVRYLEALRTEGRR
ncbi:MAG TPA: hypothetical protein VNO22_09675 [Planctomycetota bacterium]|nr:hypothetical protein [Planctomycetota bacterium]